MTQQSFLVRLPWQLEGSLLRDPERVELLAMYLERCLLMHAARRGMISLCQAEQPQVLATQLIPASWNSIMRRRKMRRSMRFSTCKPTNGRNSSRKWPSERIPCHMHVYILRNQCPVLRPFLSVVEEENPWMSLITLRLQGTFATVAVRKVCLRILNNDCSNILTVDFRSLDPSMPHE